MFTRAYLWVISKSLVATKKVEALLNRRLAKIAISELTKAIEGKSSILIYDPPCALDGALDEGATRQSLKTWDRPHNVTW